MTEPSFRCGTDRSPERVRYFEGLLLDAHDFQAEQDYHRERSALHNRLHGWGVVCGLAVGSTDPASSSVTVSPGVAVDPRGRDILLCEPVVLDLAGWMGPPGPGKVYVTVEYAEEEHVPRPIPTPGDVAMQATRTREVPRVRVTHEEPESGGVSRPGTALVLAMVEVAGRAPVTADMIDNRRRRRHPLANETRHDGRSDDPMAASLERQIRLITGAVAVLAVGLATALMTRRRS